MRIPFPFNGIDKGRAAHLQELGTTSDMNNVRPYDTLNNRARGGQRPGLDKWGDGDQIGAAEQPVVAMVTVSTVS